MTATIITEQYRVLLRDFDFKPGSYYQLYLSKWDITMFGIFIKTIKVKSTVLLEIEYNHHQFFSIEEGRLFSLNSNFQYQSIKEIEI